MEFLILLIFAVICAMVAGSKGRSAVGWFILGFFFPIIALILVCVLPNLVEQEQREGRLRQENRRLREKVRKDRHVADERHLQTQSRLTAHDRALGVDTSSRLAQPDPVERLAPPPVPGSADVRSMEWYYVVQDQNERRGPISFTELREHFERGDVNSSTLVWTEDQTDWMPLREHLELQEALIA